LIARVWSRGTGTRSGRIPQSCQQPITARLRVPPSR
jgi:hypothetical protein